jgi:transcriptional regulator with XRE-family HTH domain
MSDAPRYAGFGDYLRAQRQLAHLSLRQLADLTKVSNPYLSQLERGMHQPSVAVLKALADALDVSFDMLLTQVAGPPGDNEAASDDERVSTEAAIRNDPRLSATQKAALLSVYQSMVTEQ